MNLVNHESCDVVKSLSLTATKIAIQNFEWRYVTLVFFNSTVWCGVEIFLQSYGKSAIVGNGSFYPKFVHTTRQYVLFGITLDDVEYVLKWMRNHEFDNTGKYIIVCQSQNSSDCDETKATTTFWEHKVTNVVFLKNVGVEVTGYTYFPLNDSECRTDIPVKFKSLDACVDGHHTSCIDLFEMKLTNFHMCPLVASTFIQPPYMKISDGVPRGADGSLLAILAEGLNANLTVMTPRIGNGWGKLDEDGSWSGSLADVYYDYANFSMTSCALTLARFSYFQLSVSYNRGGVIWVTHPAKMMPSSLKLMHPFQLNTQLAVAMCFVLVCICALIRRSRFWNTHAHVIEGDRPQTSIVFYSWMVCMGLPSTRLPTKPAYLVMLLLWMWFCVFLRTFYQVTLITVLKTNYHFSEFKTIDDAVEAQYPFGGGAALKDYYIDYPTIYDNWIDVKTNDIIPTLREVSEGLEFVLAMSFETARTIISEERMHVQIIPEKIVTSPTVILFKKFSPIAKSVNEVLVKLIESGFSHKFKQDYAKSPAAYKPVENMKPITMEHYTGCYMLLLTGWIISFLFFLGEIVYPRMLIRFQREK